jgi:hypothetical protein
MYVGMDKIIQMEKHHIEAWGIWWIQWQQQKREELKNSVSSKGKDPAGNPTTLLVLPPK